MSKIHSTIASLADRLASNFRGEVTPSGESFLIITGKTVGKNQPVRLKVEALDRTEGSSEPVGFVVTSAPEGADRDVLGPAPSFKGNFVHDEGASRISNKAALIWKRLGDAAVIDMQRAAEVSGPDFAETTNKTAAALVNVKVQSEGNTTTASFVTADGEIVVGKVQGTKVKVLGLSLSANRMNALVSALTADEG